MKFPRTRALLIRGHFNSMYYICVFVIFNVCNIAVFLVLFLFLSLFIHNMYVYIYIYIYIYNLYIYIWKVVNMLLWNIFCKVDYATILIHSPLGIHPNTLNAIWPRCWSVSKIHSRKIIKFWQLIWKLQNSAKVLVFLYRKHAAREIIILVKR